MTLALLWLSEPGWGSCVQLRLRDQHCQDKLFSWEDSATHFFGLTQFEWLKFTLKMSSNYLVMETLSVGDHWACRTGWWSPDTRGREGEWGAICCDITTLMTASTASHPSFPSYLILLIQSSMGPAPGARQLKPDSLMSLIRSQLLSNINKSRSSRRF